MHQVAMIQSTVLRTVMPIYVYHAGCDLTNNDPVTVRLERLLIKNGNPLLVTKNVKLIARLIKLG